MPPATRELPGARRTRSRVGRRCLPACVAMALLVRPAGASDGPAELPLGPRTLDERRVSLEVAPGVGLTRILRQGRAGDGRPVGPWRIYMLAIDRARLHGRLGAILSNGRIPGRERPSSMAGRARAVAAVNGGFFVPFGAAGEGEPIGTLAIGGELLSEPVGDRTSLLIPESPAARVRIARIGFRGGVSIRGRRRLIDGVDRPPGHIPACGGRGGDRPTERPNAALTCRDPSELVVFSRAFGGRTRTGRRAVEAVVEGGIVTAVRRRGDGRIPRDGLVLAGTGDAASFLAATARRGARPRLRLELRAGGRPLRLRDYAAIVGAGPRLLRAGRVEINSRAEGYYGALQRSFVRGRNPRTLAGVAADGRVLLVAIDGRRRGWSAGATLTEAGGAMRALGARDAMNLDGGGSTTMAVNGRVVNRPSDRSGERPVADAIAVLP